MLPDGADLRRARLRIWVIAGLLAVVSGLHWLIPVGGQDLHLLHVALRKLFILPVVLAGIWFGLRGGALAAGATTAAYLPFVSIRWAGQASENLNQLGEVFSLWIIGLVAGYLAGRETRRLASAAEAAMLERVRLEGVVDSAGVGMMQVDPDISLPWYSARISHWLRTYPLEVGKVCPLIVGDHGCTTCVARQSFETGRPASAERRQVGKSGGEAYFRHSASPVKGRDGEVLQVVEVIEDFTNRRALEEEAIRSGKLSVLGRMAAGIAHEIGNPLSSMSTRLQLLERRRDEGFVTQSVEVLRKQIERIFRIVQGVSNFSRTGRRDAGEFEVNGLIEEMVGVIELDRRAKGIQFVRQLEAPSPRLSGVRDQIGQILLNLLLNAVEASPKGGTVTVHSCRSGDQLRLSVDDEGPGIDPETRDHLFEPFYTTKPEGTGLGLSISFGFAAAHGGRIEVERRAVGGARLVLVLPVHGPHTDVTGKTPESPAS